MLALFDLDNTLSDRTGAFHRWATAFCGGQGLDQSEVAWLKEADEDGSLDRPEFFEKVRSRFGLRPTVAELVAAYAESAPTFHVLDEAVATGLWGLRAVGFRLAIVTNAEQRPQRAKIMKTGLDAWCISGEEGISKPDPRILHRAAAKVDAELTPESWMVGDNPEADIGAAANAGVRSIWISRGQVWPKLEFEPTVVAQTVVEAIEIVVQSPSG